MTPLDVARSYLARGWMPIPVRYKSKKPFVQDWDEVEFSEANVERHFSRDQMNIGVRLGPLSGNLADIDLDAAEAVSIAKYFLPATGAVFGRTSKPKSHYLYTVSDAPNLSVIKTMMPREEGQRRGTAKPIVEYRIGGERAIQTVFPGSVHEDTGEAIEWAGSGDPAAVEHAVLHRAVVLLSAAAVLLKNWPRERGGRHDVAFKTSGFLARAGLTLAEVQKIILVMCTETGDTQVTDRMQAADSAVNGLGTAPGTYGIPSMIDAFSAEICDSLCKILDYRPGGGGGDTDELKKLFSAFGQTNQFIFRPNGKLWSPTQINQHFPPVMELQANGQPRRNARGKIQYIKPTEWLVKNRWVQDLTWAPGMPQDIENKIIREGGWTDHPGSTTYNQYLPPVNAGRRGDPSLWLEHVRKLYPTDFDHIIKCLAHRIQKPHEKINHALLLGGSEGIGKDMILKAAVDGVGSWNWVDESPSTAMEGNFNLYMRSVVLRINEVHDLGDSSRFKFRERMKAIIAAPPDVVRVNGKYMPHFSIPNITFVIFTTNHYLDALYLPESDRRTYAAWSAVTKEDFTPEYWANFWRWYQADGISIVIDHLRHVNLADFDAKAPPPLTEYFWQIVSAGQAPETALLADALDELKENGELPNAVTIPMLLRVVPGPIGDWLDDRKNAMAVSRQLLACNYARVKNPNTSRGQWSIRGKRVLIYAKTTLLPRDQYIAAQTLVDRFERDPNYSPAATNVTNLRPRN